MAWEQEQEQGTGPKAKLMCSVNIMARLSGACTYTAYTMVPNSGVGMYNRPWDPRTVHNYADILNLASQKLLYKL